MQLRSFFILLLKICGLFFFVKTLLYLPEIFGSLLIVFADYSDYPFSLWIYSITPAIIYLIVGWLLTMKTSLVADYLMKEEENTEINPPLISLISVAVIVAGGFLVIYEIPNLIIQLSTKFTAPQFNQTSYILIASIVKMLIGVWMIFAHKWIAEKLSKA